MDFLNELIVKINGFLSDIILIVSLLGCGSFFTIKTKGVQFRELGNAFRLTFKDVFKKNEKGISSFSALAVAIAAQVGTGNVAGVATAIIAGGPGAIFWMWLAAILGMSTIFAEAILAQSYREIDEKGHYYGGPSFYLKNGLGKKYPKLGRTLAGIFSVLIIIALGFIGNMVQSNSIATAIESSFNISTYISGIIIALIGAFIFIGGIKRIAKFAQLIVPFMAIIYIGLSLIIIFKFRENIFPTIKLIFESAFNPKAALGGGLGITLKAAISKGVGRGLFSNEAGMGSTPHAHATAHVAHPAIQGFSAMVGVFFDTIIVCTATSLIILVTGAESSGLNGALVTQFAFTKAFGHYGGALLTICLTFFAFSTIIGWYYFGETNVIYLFGKEKLNIYRFLVMAFIIIGSSQSIDLVWNLADFFNSLMVVPNIIGLIMLNKIVLASYDDYKNNFVLKAR
ncbi:alanine/glycine:cation symporter family protein [Peptoniphilus raoultii]|uniref:alanine/glycine:cation symporter family protein n=1 Tax=Peptoniphilus raoultii TaxID=1776387 RepID=UPI0008DA72BF|nr:sodium:alanine symporter family protein [Peptoniphilus raoultii]